MKSSFRDRSVHIVGMARSGMAAAEVLCSLGARVVMHDSKREVDLADQLSAARSRLIECRVGERAYSGIEDADIVVTSPGVPDWCPGLGAAASAGIPVLPEIELAFRISPAPIVAITGTNGKTTTTALVGDILIASGMRVFVAGNIVAGDIRLPLVTAAFQAAESDVIVAEISSFQLETISSFRPRVAALLNVTADHLDRHPDIETYARMKGRIFEYQGEGDTAVLNADDPLVCGLRSGIRSRVWEFSRSHEVDAGTFLQGSEVWASTESGRIRVCDTGSMNLRGLHNLENVLAASAMAMALGSAPEGVQKAIDAFKPLEHRMEPVADFHGIEFINNSMCTNVAAAVKSLEAIGRPAVVIAGGKDKGSDYAPLGEAFVQHAKHVVLIGQDAPLIEAAAHAAGYDRMSHAASMEEAISTALEQAVAGDTVVLSPACASFGMFRDFEERGRVFKELVRSLVEKTEG